MIKPSSGNGRCSALASSHGARIQTSCNVFESFYHAFRAAGTSRQSRKHARHGVRRLRGNVGGSLPSHRLLRSIRMRQRPLVVKHHSQIAAIDPGTAGFAFDEVFGLVGRRVNRFAEVLAACDIGAAHPSASHAALVVRSSRAPRSVATTFTAPRRYWFITHCLTG
jgi:hypothetical protein